MAPSELQTLFQQLDDAVAEVFELMLSRSCIPAPAQCIGRGSGFSAQVSFSGSFNGACALHLTERSAGELAEQLTGEPPHPGSLLAADAVGELCNMIAGSWKSRLTPALAACSLSSPTVMSPPVRQTAAHRNTLSRAYSFAPHCLTLELTLI